MVPTWTRHVSVAMAAVGVAGFIGSFFDAVGPVGLIVAGAAMTVFVAVATPTVPWDDPLWPRGPSGRMRAVTVAVSVELSIVGGLALLHRPWRTTGLWLLAAGAAVLLVLPVVTRRSREAGWDTDDDTGLIVLFGVPAAVLAVCVSGLWAVGVVLVVTVAWWLLCVWLAAEVRFAGILQTGDRWSRAIGVGRVMLGVLTVAGTVAAMVLPVAVAGALGLPPLDGPDRPIGTWLYGVIGGAVGFTTVLMIKLVAAPAPPAASAVPEPTDPAPVATDPAPEPTDPAPVEAAAVDLSFSGTVWRGVVGCLWIVSPVMIVGGLTGSIPDAARPAGVITAGVGTTLLAVLAAGRYRPGPAFAVVRTVTLAASLDLMAVGGLALLHQPWRTVGTWLLASGAALLLLFRFVAAVEGPSTGVYFVQDAEGNEAWGPLHDGGIVLIVGVPATLVAVFSSSWRTGGIVVCALVVCNVWFGVCGWLANGYRRARVTGFRFGMLGMVAVACGLVATALPVVVAGAFGVPPLDGAGLPREAWWYGLIAGSAGFLVALTIRLTTPSPEPIPSPDPEASLVPSSAPFSTSAFSAASAPPVPAGPVAVDLPFVETAETAMRLAVSGLPSGGRLTTGRVLAALVRTDPFLDWQRIWLHTGDPVADLPSTPDSPDAAGTPRTWRDLPVSDRLADSLRLARRIGDRYPHLPAGSTGVLALALLARRGNGAADRLLAPGTLTHADLLRLVQRDIVGSTLPNLGHLIPAAWD